ncbi:hypothetical protein JAAARDRAFT_715115 [Jaapia argillacea MUCL 33604]|uniref:Nephrocystin 3-like N-terminal domain-containing protein n=1 Tax=Jaapia argillacea MUCL 33604 TaxID=933084 RepID=A0A067PVZ3_9AGAM|nr:hypothetical protein JAAARDRAFT_715115 [Jaapia argillacea MUCL 33604]
MRKRVKFVRSFTPNPTPSQPSPELVSLLRDPDLPTFVTSVGQEVAAALTDVGEVLGHFPFVKTIGGLTVQILKIVERVRDNVEKWERLADYTCRTFRVLEVRLLSAPDGVDLEIQQSCDELARIRHRSLKQLLDRAKSKQNESIAQRLAHHQLDVDAHVKDVHADLKDVHANLKDMHANLKDVHANLKDVHADLKDVHADLKDVHASVKDLALLVQGAEWRDTLICCEGTRAEILHEIEDWGFPNTSPRAPIAYLCGVAGLRKTTIAHTVAYSLHKQKRLGGSFFFSRDDAPRCSRCNVWAMIAYHLTFCHQSFWTHLCDVLKQSIPSTSDCQFSELLLGPLKASKPPASPFVIVMDALDECDDAVDILQLVCQALDCLQSHIKLFLMSRLETQFDRIVPLKDTLCLYIDLCAPPNQDDLARYFDTRMRTICTDNEGVKLLPWPNPQLRQDLLDGAGGLFIWASAVCDFLEQSRDLDEDLRLILNPPDDARDDPEERLEAIYRVVLERAYTHLKRSIYQDSFCPLLAVIMSIAEPLSLENLSSLVGIKDAEGKIDALLGKSAASPGPACHLSLQTIENADANELCKIHNSLTMMTVIDLHSLAAIFNCTFVTSIPETDSQELVDLLERILKSFDKCHYHCCQATSLFSLPLAED